MKIKKGALVKYRKYPYLSYKVYRIKEMDTSHIILVPAINYISHRTLELPTKLLEIPELFSFLSEEECRQFETKEFEHACYQACVDVDKLIEKLESLDKYSESHRINGEINSTIIGIKQKFQRIGGKDYEI